MVRVLDDHDDSTTFLKVQRECEGINLSTGINNYNL
jgi:hypothetical protein